MGQLIYKSSVMKETVRLADRFAKTDRPVLIMGEPGTGKEPLARRIYEKSARKSAAFIPINCSALTESLAESELFGHVRGAFTGASGARAGVFRKANRGTVFFDEVGELSTNAQPKLLRFLEEGEVKPVGADVPEIVDVRVIAATNRDLHSAVDKGTFRADLLDRLSVHVLQVPPLRDRGEDVLLIAETILGVRSEGKQSFSHNAKALLLMHDWPGNVRELRNLVDNVVARTGQKSVTREELAPLLPTDLRSPPLREARKLKVFQSLCKIAGPQNTNTEQVDEHKLQAVLGTPASSLRDVLQEMVAEGIILEVERPQDKPPFYRINPKFLDALSKPHEADLEPEIMTALGQWKPFTKLGDLELVMPPGPDTVRYRKKDDEQPT